MNYFLIILNLILICSCGPVWAQQFTEKQAQPHENLLKNPGFESGFRTAWTITAGTATPDTSNELAGVQAMSVAVSSVNGSVFSQTVSAGDCGKYAGLNMEASIYLKTASATFEMCSQVDGVTLQCQDVNPTDTWNQYILNFPAVAGDSCGILVRTSEATTGTIKADKAYLGLATNIGTVAQAQLRLGASRSSSNQTISTVNETTLVYNNVSGAYFDAFGEFNTATGVWTSKLTGRVMVDGGGTISSGSAEQFIFRLRKDGIAGATVCTWVGNGATTQFPFALPGCAVDVVVGTTLQITADSTADASYDFAQGSTAFFRIVSVPTSSAAAVFPNESNYGWTAFTPTGGHTTNTTYTGRKSRVCDVAKYQVKLAYGGQPNAVNLTINIPDGLIDTAKLTSSTVGEVVLGYGQLVDAGTGLTPVQVVYSSTSSVRVQMLSGDSDYSDNRMNTITNEWTGLGTNVAIASGDYVTVNFEVPIVGWNCNQNAPLLVGSVTSNSQGMLRIEAARLECAATSAATNQMNSGAIAIANASGGNCAVTFNPPFAVQPWCNLSHVNATQTLIVSPKLTGVSASGATMTSAQVSTGSSTIAAATNALADVVCFGFR